MGVSSTVLSLGCEWAHSLCSSSSYSEAIPTMEEGAHSVNLPVDDGSVVRMGVGNVSAATWP